MCGGFIQGSTLEGLFGGEGSPGFAGDAAECDACLLDNAVCQVERHSTGRQCKLIGFAIANLEIQRTPRPRSGRDNEASDQIAGLQVRCNMWRIARKAVQLLERHAARAILAHDLNSRAERCEGLSEIARIVRDAMLAYAQHRQFARDPAERGAARAGSTLVACRIARVAKVGASRALHDVACERR